eukprot:scaffold11334_cov17-Tisochrysis_lutea.AAC.1
MQNEVCKWFHQVLVPRRKRPLPSQEQPSAKKQAEDNNVAPGKEAVTFLFDLELKMVLGSATFDHKVMVLSLDQEKGLSACPPHCKGVCKVSSVI